MITTEGPFFRFHCGNCGHRWEALTRGLGRFCPDCDGSRWQASRRKLLRETPNVHAEAAALRRATEEAEEDV